MTGPVCFRCIQEPSLAAYVRTNASETECAYCGHEWKRPRAIPFDDLVDHMRERIAMEYEDPANSVGYCTADGGYLLPTMDGAELLDELGLGWDLENDSLRDDLAAAFDDQSWVHKNPYSLTENEARRVGWERFVRLVKHRVRYLQFPPHDDPYDDPEVTAPGEMLAELGELFVTHQLVSTLAAGTELVRVRIHQPGSPPANTLAELGPPPIEAARFANRMSPAGVSMLYVCLDEATAVAETYVRHDGEPAEATIAVFRLTEDLSVLNLTELPAVPNLFDGDEANLSRAAIGFLHDFNRDLTKPVEKDGREHIEYVPSQIVTEYVRYRLPVQLGRSVHGILYRSARRSGGIGCVLFLAHEDLQDEDHSFRAKPPLALLVDRTRTIGIATGPPSDESVPS